MANRSQYPNRSWKIYRNTSSFVPKPGDIAVWTYGWAGHTAIVVGPSDKRPIVVWTRIGLGLTNGVVRERLLLIITITVTAGISILLDRHTKQRKPS